MTCEAPRMAPCGGPRPHLQLRDLRGAQLARAQTPRLVEVGLHRGPVVHDRHVLSLPLGHDHVNVHLGAVEVRLEPASARGRGETPRARGAISRRSRT